MPRVTPPERITDPERAAFYRRVFELLSAVVEGEVSPEMSRRIIQFLAADPALEADRETLQVTIGVASECGRRSEDLVDEARFAACVERVRCRLGEIGPR